MRNPDRAPGSSRRERTLLLTPLDGDAARPWVEGELVPGEMSDPADHDPADLLSSWWTSYAAGNGDWPGLAPAGADLAGADATADRGVNR